MAVSIGIDFGTSTTLIAVRRENQIPEIVPIGTQSSWMPSVVAMGQNGNLLVGEEADLEASPFRSIKSFISSDDERSTEFGASPRDLIEMLLLEALERAKKAAPEINDDAEFYLGCPADWNGEKRRLLADIAHSVGISIDIAEIIDEPIAAGLAWVENSWFVSSQKPTGRVLVFDAGGGTLDIAVLQVESDDSDNNRVTVLSSGSIGKSGDAVDRAIAEFISQQNGLDQNHDYEPTTDISLLKDAQRVKEQLSFVESVSNGVAISRLGQVEVNLNRSKLSEILDPQIKQSLSLVDMQIRLAKLRGKNPCSVSDLGKLDKNVLCSEFDHVVMSGGLSSLPMFSDAMNEMFPMAQIHIVQNPQELVALGLTFGSRLQSLNLPRPPVNFVVKSSSFEQVIYEAFTPLYNSINPMYAHLYKHLDFPQFVDTEESYLQCKSPTRDGRELEMMIAIKHDAGDQPHRWWEDKNSNWRHIRPMEVPSELDFVAEIDMRTQDREYEEDNFVDAVDYLSSLHRDMGYETSLFVGDAIFLDSATSEGSIVLNVDGTVLIQTRRGMSPGCREMKLKVLYWPLKSVSQQSSVDEYIPSTGQSKDDIVLDPSELVVNVESIEPVSTSGQILTENEDEPVDSEYEKRNSESPVWGGLLASPY